MVCKNCKENPVIQLTNNNIKLCKSCFIRYFEKKFKRTIRQYELLERGDHVVVGLSDKGSLSVLYLLNKIANNRVDIKITALLIDEGNKNVKEFCKKNNVKLVVISYEKDIGKSFSVRSILRRSLLNKKARELKASKLAIGHNLDDEAQSIIMNQFRHNVALSARLGPKTSVRKDPKFIPRIKPLYFLTENEVELYATLKEFKMDEDKYKKLSYRYKIGTLLNNLEEKYPGTKHAIVASFLEILPLLKEKYKNQKIDRCNKCGEPSSSDVCSVCK